MRRRLAVAVFTAFAASATAAPPDPNTAYKDLVAAYAAGNRAAAVAGVGDLDEDAIRSGVESLAQHPPRTLLAAVMLHTDRRLIARRFIDAPETRPACESAHTEPAWRTAEHMLLRSDAVDYARRWAVAVALQDHWDGCFEDAVRFIDNAARWFPADAGVLLARGAIYETIATLPVQVPRSGIASTAGTKLAVAVAAHERTRLLAEARRSLERALAIDPRLDAARLRLGRILWRAGRADAAAAALQAVIDRGGDDAVAHLAHLFLARVHQDADRGEAAVREYRSALALEPGSQAAAMGLSDALQLTGEPAAARAIVEAALTGPPRPTTSQAFWEYQFADARQASGLLDGLRDAIAP